MRNKAILILIGFLVMIGLICFFWGNSIITRVLENTLQAIIGAKVEIEGFRLNPFKLAVQMESIQITNPADTWKNIIAANKISFKLAPGPLFEGKKVIDEIVVEDLIFNDKRQTDGKLKKKVSPKSTEKKQSKLSRAIATMPILKPETIADNLNLEKITASYQFKTDLSAAKIKSELAAYQQKWDANLEELNDLKVEIQGLDDKIAKLKKPNNLMGINEQLDLVKEIRDAAKKIQTELQTANDQFQKDNQALEDAIKGLKEEAEVDYQALLALAKLPDIGNINYAEALLGKTMFKASSVIFNVIGYLQKSLPAKGDNPPKAKPTRGGQNIVFPGRKTYPRFLIKKIAISGKGTPDSSTDGFYVNGIVTGITSEPPIYGLPMTTALFAQTPNQTLLRLDGELNHVTPEFKDKINLTLKGLPLPQLDLSDSKYLPSKILSGRAEINAVAKMDPDLMKLEVLITADNIKTDFSGNPEPDDLISEIVQNTLVNLNQVTVDYQLEQIKDQLEMKISSNLNQIISNRLQETVGEKVTGFTRELRAEVDAKLLKEEKSLDAVKQRFQKTVDAELNEFQVRINLEEQKIEAKRRELEAKKKELERGLQKKIGAEEEKLEEKLQRELDSLKNKL